MKILILGGGAREHALARALSTSAGTPQVLVAPGNAGMRDVAIPLGLGLDDLDAVAERARRDGVALVVAGSEDPLVRDAAAVFAAHGVPFFGPSGAAAQLEGSKRFAKEFMRRADIPTADFEVVDDFDRARAALGRRDYPLVVKADGLAAGKGVWITADAREAEEVLRRLLVDGRLGAAGRIVLLEEALSGPEVSVFALCAGMSYRILGVAQDAKRAFDGDQGPNTGGMGAYSPVPGVDAALLAAIERRIVVPTLSGMAAEGRPYGGFLYFGLMLTPNGPRVLEYNCRLGDPEAQVLLPRLDGDLLSVLQRAAAGDVGSTDLDDRGDAAVGVVLAARGYPEAPHTGARLDGLEAARELGALVYCAGVREDAGGLVTAGGRVCTVVGRGPTLGAARTRAYAAIVALRAEDTFYRSDIARRILEANPCPNPG